MIIKDKSINEFFLTYVRDFNGDRYTEQMLERASSFHLLQDALFVDKSINEPLVFEFYVSYSATQSISYQLRYKYTYTPKVYDDILNLMELTDFHIDVIKEVSNL